MIDLTRQQELTKQQESKAKEAEYRAQAAAQAKVGAGCMTRCDVHQVNTALLAVLPCLPHCTAVFLIQAAAPP